MGKRQRGKVASAGAEADHVQLRVRPVDGILGGEEIDLPGAGNEEIGNGRRSGKIVPGHRRQRERLAQETGGGNLDDRGALRFGDTALADAKIEPSVVIALRRAGKRSHGGRQPNRDLLQQTQGFLRHLHLLRCGSHRQKGNHAEKRSQRTKTPIGPELPHYHLQAISTV